MDQEEYIKQRLDQQINWYDTKSVGNQRWFKRLQLLIIIASSSIPFISGYISTDSTELKLLVGALGLLVAAATAVLGLYQFQENWMEYRTTCESLRHEKYLFLTGAAPYNVEDSFHLLVERVEGLISKENTNWVNYTKRAQRKKSER